MQTIVRSLLVWVLYLGSSVAEETVIDAADLDALRAAAGTQVRVVGQVVSIGNTSDNRITFLNFSLPKKEGFVAVIHQSNYDAFPEGFDIYRAQNVEITGVLELYKNNQPQIILRSPDQIKILNASDSNNTSSSENTYLQDEAEQTSQ